MKCYTDLEQSKKLAEILPLESADMHYCLEKRDVATGYEIGIVPFIQARRFKGKCNIIDVQPAWSLAALLGVLPAECECMALEHINYGNNHKEYFMHYIGGENTENYDNPVDACVSMIEKLHGLKML